MLFVYRIKILNCNKGQKRKLDLHKFSCKMLMFPNSIINELHMNFVKFPRHRDIDSQLTGRHIASCHYLA